MHLDVSDVARRAVTTEVRRRERTSWRSDDTAAVNARTRGRSYRAPRGRGLRRADGAARVGRHVRVGSDHGHRRSRARGRLQRHRLDLRARFRGGARDGASCSSGRGSGHVRDFGGVVGDESGRPQHRTTRTGLGGDLSGRHRALGPPRPDPRDAALSSPRARARIGARLRQRRLHVLRRRRARVSARALVGRRLLGRQDEGGTASERRPPAPEPAPELSDRGDTIRE